MNKNKLQKSREGKLSLPVCVHWSLTGSLYAHLLVQTYPVRKPGAFSQKQTPCPPQHELVVIFS